MKTAHYIMLGLCLCAAASFAADYTWTGGGTDSGDWTESANWGVESGYPVAGDTATFSSDATITSDFSLGGEEGTTDVLTITIDSGVTLTINASISGEAGLTREGAGTLVLKKSNPFHGKFQANGWTDKDKSKANIITRIFDGGALGTQSASFDNGLNYSFSSLVVDAGDSANGMVEISIPLRLGRLESVTGRPNLQVVNGGADFGGSIATPSRLVVDGNSATEVWFRQAFTYSQWYQFDSRLSSSAHYYFCKKITTGTWYIPYCPSYLHLMAPSNTIYVYQLNNTKVVCETNDVLTLVKMGGTTTNRDTFPWSNSSDTAGGRIDLNGFDQHFPNVTNGLVLVTQNYGFTSPADKPAKVVMDGPKMKTQVFNGRFFGKAGFEWNPTDASAEFIFSNNQHSTSGELAISNGAVRLSGGASFTNLSSLVVGATGAFAVDTGSGSQLFAETVTAASGAKLKLAAGTALRTKNLVVGDAAPVTAIGRYTATEYPDLIEGDGAVEISGGSCSFTGASGGLWSEPTNWSGGAVPGATSDVTIPAGKTVVLDATNEEVFRLTLGDGSTTAATLKMANWNTCLQAKAIDVMSNSKITCAGPFTNETDKARVWIKCDTLSIAAGASIDVNKRGWSGGLLTGSGNRHTKVKNCDGIERCGFGPGRGKTSHSAAAHFGLGGYPGLGKNRGWCYDDPYAPAEPGSGGAGMDYEEYGAWSGLNDSAVYGNLSGTGVTHGGGAVRIEATGAVVVNGSILASAGGACTQFYFIYYGRYDVSGSGGSGGSVHISCSNISGSGVIRADGGDGNYPVWPNNYFKGGNGTIVMGGSTSAAYPGGGGGIAIEYDPSRQTAGACAGMTISAAGGTYTGLAPRSDAAETARFNKASFATMDKYLTDAEPGTLVFSDDKLVADTIGSKLSGRILGINSFTHNGDLTISKSHVRFAATGATVRVTGNLTIADGARLDLGGIYSLTNRGWRAVYLERGNQPVSLTVDGDLVVSNDAALAVYAGGTGFSTWGGEVLVGGTFAVGAGGHVYPSSDGWTGGSPHFTAGSFSLDADGEVNADWRGGAAGYAGGDYWYSGSAIGKGPDIGSGKNGGGNHSSQYNVSAIAGGHFGRGAFSTIEGGAQTGGYAGFGCANDDRYLPVFCGSGGGSGGYGYGGDGGGIFHLATTGAVQVAGTISANARFGNITGEYAYFSSTGAGGTIFLAGGTVDVADTATLSVQGGHSLFSNSKGVAPGGGSGGIISVWGGYDRVLNSLRSRIRHATTVSGLPESAAGLVNWEGTALLYGGTNYHSSAGTTAQPAAFGPDGSLTFSTADPGEGVMVIVK